MQLASGDSLADINQARAAEIGARAAALTSCFRLVEARAMADRSGPVSGRRVCFESEPDLVWGRVVLIGRDDRVSAGIDKDSESEG